MKQRFGPELDGSGTTFRLWAPAAKQVDLLFGGALHAMQRSTDGWYTLHRSGVGAGALYAYRIDGHLEVPDPGSAFQPRDITGPSEVIDHGGFAWQVADWRGRPWQDVVFLEA